MATKAQTAGHQPAVDKSAENEDRPTPPTGGSGVKAPAKVESAVDLVEKLSPLITNIERLDLAKARSYLDRDQDDIQNRQDRSELLISLSAVFSDESLPNWNEDVGYYTEKDFVDAYASGMRSQGLFLLPSVVDTVPADTSGNVIVVVDFALASTTGAYWPAMVRVSGMGNDRVATNRGGTGDKALTTAMSAAWKEAIIRIGFLAGRYDPEKREAAHLPLTNARPSNPGQQRGNALTVQQEDEFRSRLIESIRRQQTLDALDALMNRDDVKAKWSLIGSRTRKTLQDEQRDQERRIRDARSRIDRDDDRGGRNDDRGGHDDDGGGAAIDEDDLPF